MNTALVFGTFDPIHPGHEYVFREAKKLGDRLVVVVARDATIQKEKNREHHMSEQDRVTAVKSLADIDEALLGDESPDSYELLLKLDFTTLVLGYDQRPSDEEVWAILSSIGKPNVAVVRLAAYKPEQYKSSLMRTS